MLPLSTIEDQETEEVQTKPPEKGALPSENTDDPPKKPIRMKGTMLFRVLPFCPVIPWTSSEPALPGRQGQALSKPARSCPAAQTEAGSGGSTCGVTMLPLSTIEGQETEEVQTKPPEKGVLLSENPDDPPKKPIRMKGMMLFRVLPFCPVIPWTSSEPALRGRQGQALSKPARSCPAAQPEAGSGGSTCGVTMLPLRTIEGQETEEVQTKPPEKGALLPENPGEPRKKSTGMKGRLSFRVLPICPMPSVCFTYYLEQDDPDSDSQFPPEPLKTDPNCTFVPLPVLEFHEIKVCECPLCCLSFVTAS
ncbi:uncharacterized protein LOC101288959 isoform X4 [Orcinus orca]|uniref:uncharacterized protein LOC101288959 isoform X4 n=1 Tax=Orcinus orca TaxID=9733 RepID=UPI002112BA7F|nr:uncharacterized protein LOC101288959 isoform X4 [Orcinus orca]